MKRRATRADVADQAGVSKTTVTYVLSDRMDIAIPETTRERVRSIASQLGYRPHAAARALKSGRTYTVTVALPVRIYAHNARVLQAFDRHTNAHGYHMMASTIGRNDREDVRQEILALLDNLTDGVILVDMPGAFRPHIAEVLAASTKPLVCMGVFTVPDMDCVEVNIRHGATEALEHLLAFNPPRIALFGPGKGHEYAGVETYAAPGDVDPRIAVYCSTMEQRGRPLEIICGNPTDRRISREALQGYISQHGCPDALFCFNDEMAISAHRTLREMGLRIPGDVLLVGCDGSEEGEYLDPPLSTVVQPLDRMCELAWEFVMNRLDNPGIPQQQITVDAELTVRSSSQR